MGDDLQRTAACWRNQYGKYLIIRWRLFLPSQLHQYGELVPLWTENLHVSAFLNVFTITPISPGLGHHFLQETHWAICGHPKITTLSTWEFCLNWLQFNVSLKAMGTPRGSCKLRVRQHQTSHFLFIYQWTIWWTCRCLSLLKAHSKWRR